METNFKETSKCHAVCSSQPGSSGTRGERKTQFLIRFYSIAGISLLIDQLSKYWALQVFELGTTQPIIPGFFHFTLLFNTGIAFGFFQRHPEILFILISISLVILILMAFQMSRQPENHSALAVWGLALILGGAVGNWIDRIRFQAVVDFLDFRVWPVFNVADSAISIGVGLYFILLFRKQSS